MAIDSLQPNLTRRSSSLDRPELEAPPTIGISGWVAIIAVLVLSYVTLAHADITGRSADQGPKPISADAFMLVVGSGR